MFACVTCSRKLCHLQLNSQLQRTERAVDRETRTPTFAFYKFRQVPQVAMVPAYLGVIKSQSVHVPRCSVPRISNEQGFRRDAQVPSGKFVESCKYLIESWNRWNWEEMQPTWNCALGSTRLVDCLPTNKKIRQEISSTHLRWSIRLSRNLVNERCNYSYATNVHLYAAIDLTSPWFCSSLVS